MVGCKQRHQSNLLNNNQRSRLPELKKESMKTSKRARVARKNLPKNPVGEKDRKPGTARHNLRPPPGLYAK